MSNASDPSPPSAPTPSAPRAFSAEYTPFDALGGRAVVVELASRFYDHMDAHEPALARLHRLDAAGRVHPESRERFALFLIGWLGGPQDYVQQHGHPRLRMRHGAVPIGEAERDAWLRCMQAAMDAMDIRGEVRTFLDARFADVADFLRNRPG